MITIKMFETAGHKEMFHFQNIDKFSKWLDLYWKKFNHFEYVDTKKPSEKIVFKSKHGFEQFYKRAKG